MARAVMSDEEWALLAPYLAPISSRSGRPPSCHRLTLDAIFWVAHRRAAWRDLPEAFGHWNTVYRQFRRWSKTGMWVRMSKALNAMPRPDSRERLDERFAQCLVPPVGTGDLRGLVSAVGLMAYDPGVGVTLSTKTKPA